MGGGVGAGGILGPKIALGLDSAGFRGRPPRGSLCPALWGRRVGRRAAVSLRPWLGMGMTVRSFFTKLTPHSDHPLLHTEKTLPKP